jgi:hypothetical protein
VDGSLENLYFKWLCAKVNYVMSPTPSLTYWRLLRILHTTEFVWLLTGDDNRAADGVELRVEFLHEENISDQPEWLSLGCSILEMFIGFSRRAQFITEVPAKDWFWEFVENLGLLDVNDGSELDDEEIQKILGQFIWRTYDKKGSGGIFPLDKPKEDQRGVEIWYQFCDYLVDKDRLP